MKRSTDAPRQLLGVAKSSHEIVDVIERWPPMKAEGVSVRSWQIRKFRPRRNGDVEFEYKLKLVKPGTAEEFAATVLGTVFHDPSGGRRYLERSRSSKHRSASAGAGRLQGFAAYLPELRLLLSSPSADERFPGLRVALDPEAMNSLFDRYLHGAGSGGGRSETRKIDVLRYKRQRCTLRYRLWTGDGAAARSSRRTLIGKTYASVEIGEQVFHVMRQLYERGSREDAHAGLRMPRPMGYIPELPMVLMEYVSGPSLGSQFGSPKLADHLGTAARTLVELHSCTLEVRKHRVTDELSRLRRWVARAARGHPELSPDLEAGASEIEARAPGEASGRPRTVLAHGDFVPSNILMASRGATVIDFDQVCNADPALDIGRFLASMRRGGVQNSWTVERTRTHAEGFLAAYGLRRTADLTARIAFYYRASLLWLACLDLLRPRSQHRATALLAELREPHPF